MVNQNSLKTCWTLWIVWC